MSFWDTLTTKDYGKIGNGIMGVLEGASSTVGANTKPKENTTNSLSQTPMSDSENAKLSQNTQTASNKNLYYAIGGVALIGILGLLIIRK